MHIFCRKEPVVQDDPIFHYNLANQELFQTYLRWSIFLSFRVLTRGYTRYTKRFIQDYKLLKIRKFHATHELNDSCRTQKRCPHDFKNQRQKKLNKVKGTNSGHKGQDMHLKKITRFALKIRINWAIFSANIKKVTIFRHTDSRGIIYELRLRVHMHLPLQRTKFKNFRGHVNHDNWRKEKCE